MRMYPLRKGFTIGDGFGPRGGQFSGFHAGVDFQVSDGTPIYACQGGTVLYIGAASGYGQWIVIDHDDADGGGVTEYGHMWNAYATGLKAGDRVEAGQLIAYVGANGQASGPHLHLSVMPRQYNPNAKIDPLPWLANAAYFGGSSPANEGEKPVNTTQFGIDISNHQPDFDFAQAAREGFTFATHKVTESDGYRDRYWPRARDLMAQHFPGRFGGYHFYRRDSDPRRQADLLLSHLGDVSIPVQLDFEDTDNGSDVADMWAIIAAIRERGMRVFSNYVPRWFWRDRMGAPDLTGTPPLWASSYVNGSGYASALYPGDDWNGWAPYGGVTPAILQFSELGTVAGQRVDVNAFRGSAADLTSLFSGTTNIKEAVMSIADDELSKKFPSRSRYRDTEEPIDTGMGFVLNIDARIHEQFVETNALRGVREDLERVKRAAGNGDARAAAVLALAEGAK